MSNPLHVPLKISQLSLKWWFENEETDSVDDNEKHISAANSESVTDFVLLPDSSKNVLLTVTPMKVGDLQITNVTYSLADADGTFSVSGMQPLIVTLPANSNYPSQDKRLHFKVVKNAPQLQVSFTGLRRHIYSSETIPLVIHFKNSGQIEISDIYIVSGSLFSIWIEGTPFKSSSGFLKIPLDNDVLIENQKLEVPVIVYPNFLDSKECLELLFYYKSSNNDTTPRYRLIRHSWPTISHNIFQITAIAKRSHSLHFKEEQAINIKMHMGINKSEKAPSSKFKIGIQCISLYSHHWRLTKNYFTPKEFIWNQDESVNFLLQAVKRKSFENPLSTIYFVPKTDRLPFKFCLPQIDENSEQDICCVINWKTDTTDEYGIHSIQGQEVINIDTVSNQLPTVPSLVPATLTIFGNTQPEKTAIHLKKLIYYQLQHPPIMKHNFRISRLCIVPVTLWLHNSSEDVQIVKVDLVALPKDLSEVDKVPDCFTWVGKTELIKEINALERINIPLKAAFAAPGAYDFTSRIAILVKLKDEMILQSCQIDATVIVS